MPLNDSLPPPQRIFVSCKAPVAGYNGWGWWWSWRNGPGALAGSRKIISAGVSPFNYS